MSDSATIVAKFAKNKSEDLVVRLDEFRGLPVVDIRVFADFDETGGERRPTRKGIAFRVTLLPQVIEALNDALAEAKRHGNFPDPERTSQRSRQSFFGGARDDC